MAKEYDIRSDAERAALIDNDFAALLPWAVRELRRRDLEDTARRIAEQKAAEKVVVEEAESAMRAASATEIERQRAAAWRNHRIAEAMRSSDSFYRFLCKPEAEFQRDLANIPSSGEWPEGYAPEPVLRDDLRVDES